MADPKLAVVARSVTELVPYPNNARKHSKRQIRQIARSIEQFGFLNPVLIDADDTVIAGHGRVEAARLLGQQTVPTIRIDHLSEAERRAYILADNRIAENAGWDREILRLELQLLDEADAELDLSITGFNVGEIDLILEPDQPKSDPADKAPPPPSLECTVSRPGDLWRLGPHRLFCGDAREPASYERLLGDERGEIVFIDPPYNVPIRGHVRSGKAGTAREFPMAVGEMSPEAFTDFLAQVFQHLARYSVDGSIHYVCMDWRHLTETLAAGDRAYGELKNLCVWRKDRAGMGSLYRSQHELVLVFKSGRGQHINNVELGRHGRDRSNVWDYPAVRPSQLDLEHPDEAHPTIKPVGLIADALRDCSSRNGLVLDVFGGSGSTLIAAERTGRRARLMELDPPYVDATIRRWEAVTGDMAIHDITSEPFADAERHPHQDTTANRGPKARYRVPAGRREVNDE